MNTVREDYRKRIELRYIVKRTQEADFGCEERPADYVPVVRVTLREEDGNEIAMEIPDAELYAKGINEGDCVCFDENTNIVKESGDIYGRTSS